MQAGRWFSVGAGGVVAAALLCAAPGFAQVEPAAPGTGGAARVAGVVSNAAAEASAPAAAPGAAADAPTFSMFHRLKATGKTGLVQLTISVFALAFALERLFNLRRSRVVPHALVETAQQLWREGKFDELKAACAASNSTLGRVILGLIAHRSRPMADLSAHAADVAGREIRVHLQKAYPLAVAATVEPLLGLFGTVLGMVGAFEAVALAGKMGDPSIMAEDISFALMTTVVGLMVAIPALLAYQFFRTKTMMLSLSLEEACSDLMAEWFLQEERK